ncbi:hypothetical protein PPERSA_07124 [Pseudocohnilembus persalinus]|uniref:hydroxyacylglutathione hydrolase n=1 Tax=Pseudocohnilembus persalinus TaxID=266149 RepID=A0A0V0QXS5_PSEPJ|nr:hypothetical protein PPERSA_07124 [Pseudocohnilembus persalinus]|eukprot:KRX06961.1 hypothetical protein PPERSA_07124 [Pseudocohnilembus persalinus]
MSIFISSQIRGKKNTGILIDPADQNSIYPFLQKYSGLDISHVLFTHKHWDHAGNSKNLKKFLNNERKNSHLKKQVVFMAHEQDQENIEGVDVNFKGNQENIEINNFNIKAFHTPCHTIGHAMYYFEPQQQQLQISEDDNKIIQEQINFDSQSALFTGDTIFLGGVGRFFEGNSQQMYKNFQILKELPKDTDIYCGHEYTVANYEWASKIEPENQNLQQIYKKYQNLRKKNKYTIPSKIEDELNTNIFVRCDQENLKQKFNCNYPVEILCQLREMKNNNQTDINTI